MITKFVSGAQTGADRAGLDGNVMAAPTLFTLQTGAWFAMERATLEAPDCSPVKILAIEQAGKRLLKINLYEAFYPEGVREKSINLRVQEQNSDCLTGADDDGRRYVFLNLTHEWLLTHFNQEDISRILDSECPAAILESFHFPT